MCRVHHVNAGLDEAQAGIKITGRDISNLRYADDTTLMAKSEEELKSLLMKVKEESGKVGLKLNIQKIKILASGPIISVQFSHSVVSNSLWPRESQHARLPCPSQAAGIHSDSCPSSQWCNPAISSSVIPFPPAPNPSQHQSHFQWVSSSHEVTSWQIDGETMETVTDFILGAPKSLQMWLQPWSYKMLAPWKKCFNKLR